MDPRDLFYYIREIRTYLTFILERRGNQFYVIFTREAFHGMGRAAEKNIF